MTSLAIHLFNGWLVFFAASFLLLNTQAALLASGLFLLHPLQSEAVIYISSRTELLACTGILLSVIGFASKRPWLAFMGLIVGVISKPHALMIPALWLLVAFYQYRLSKRTIGAVVAATGLVLLNPSLTYHVREVAAHWRGLPTQLYAMFWVLSRVFWPFNLSIEHDFRGLSSVWLIISAQLALLGLCAMLIWRHRPLGFGLIWIAVLMLPHLVGEPTGYLAEHHFYAPFFGISLILAHSLYSFKEKNYARISTDS